MINATRVTHSAAQNFLTAGVIIFALIISSTATASVQYVTDKVLPIPDLLNTLKCEVARFQVENKEYRRKSGARFVIDGAQISLKLRFAKSINQEDGFDVGIPIVDKLGLDGGIATGDSIVIVEEQSLMFEMDTRVQTLSVCDNLERSITVEDEYSVFHALKQAKRAIDSAAAGEPRIRVLTHGIKRNLIVERREDKKGGIFLLFVGFSTSDQKEESIAQEMEVVFQLGEKNVESVPVGEDPTKTFVGEKVSNLRELFWDTGIQNGESSSNWFVCIPDSLGDKNCEGTNWEAIPLCKMLPNLPACQTSAQINHGLAEPTVFGRPKLLWPQLEEMGWLPRDASQPYPGITQFHKRLEDALRNSGVGTALE